MKLCPTCRRQYEGALEFCPEDGGRLEARREVEGAPTVVPPPVGATVEDDGPPPFTNQEYPPRVDPLPTGTQVGEYIIDKQIGEGGMGVIFSATHPIIGKRVAIKVLNPALAHNPDVVARFVQEAKSVNQIRHRNIVDIFSFGVLADGRHYFVMELLEGESLAARLAREPLAPDEALPLWIEAAGAIEAAHARGIVHRDLKPDNLFVCGSPDGSFCKVLDFGIAKLLGDSPGGMSKTSTGAPIGTPMYMSPEQAQGLRDVDRRTDLYSFGIILYECVVGEPPFRGKTFIQVLAAQINDRPPSISERMQIHPDLERLIEQLLAKDPDGRPPDMAAVRRKLMALRELLSASTPLWTRSDVRPRRPARSPRAARPARRSRAPLYIGLTVPVLVAVALLGPWRFRAPPDVAAVSAPQKPTAPSPPVPSARFGKVMVSTNAIGSKVFLDRNTDRATVPAAAGGMNLKVQVPADEPCTLRIEADGYQPVAVPIKIGPGEETALPVLMVPVGSTRRSTARPQPAKPDPPPEKPPEKPHKPTNENFIDPF